MMLIEWLYKLKNLLPKDSLIYNKLKNYYYYYMTNYHYVEFLKYRFEKNLGYKLNLEKPQSFNEKLQWLKCYYRDPSMAICADKVAVRKFVAELIGEEYLTPVYRIYNTIDDINLDELPKSFVLKPSHSSGKVIICKDKDKINWKYILKKIKQWMSENYYYINGEWVYKDIKPKIICEKLLDNFNDYKFYCFNGVPKLFLVYYYESKTIKMNYYDMNFDLLPFKQQADRFNGEIKPPPCFDSMVLLAKKLSHTFPHVRVDFFVENNKIYFSELTFFDGCGMNKFNPQEWDFILGNMLELGNCKKEFIRGV